jgi:hypothetical protein
VLERPAVQTVRDVLQAFTTNVITLLKNRGG